MRKGKTAGIAASSMFSHNDIPHVHCVVALQAYSHNLFLFHLQWELISLSFIPLDTNLQNAFAWNKERGSIGSLFAGFFLGGKLKREDKLLTN